MIIEQGEPGNEQLSGMVIATWRYLGNGRFPRAIYQTTDPQDEGADYVQ
jgi:hypothetical protein